MKNIFILWFLASCSDAIAGTICAVHLFRRRTRLGNVLAVFFLCVAYEAAWAAASFVIFWPEEYTVATGFAVVRAQARTVKMFGVWALVFFFFNLCDRGGIHATLSGQHPRGKI